MSSTFPESESSILEVVGSSIWNKTSSEAVNASRSLLTGTLTCALAHSLGYWSINQFKFCAIYHFGKDICVGLGGGVEMKTYIYIYIFKIKHLNVHCVSKFGKKLQGSQVLWHEKCLPSRRFHLPAGSFHSATRRTVVFFLAGSHVLADGR